MDVLTCEQGTAEWHEARLGIPTASQFSTVLAKGKGGGDSKTRKTYLHKLAGEILTGEQMDTFGNAHTEHGHVVEGEARALYEFMCDAEVREVGFIRAGRKGCSPDGLVGDVGMVEIKRKLPHIMVETILSGRFPPAHKAQVQGQLWIAEREWCDLVCYFPSMPPFISRAYRDDEYIEQLAEAVEVFNAELDEIVAKVREYGSAK